MVDRNNSSEIGKGGEKTNRERKKNITTKKKYSTETERERERVTIYCKGRVNTHIVKKTLIYSHD